MKHKLTIFVAVVLTAAIGVNVLLLVQKTAANDPIFETVAIRTQKGELIYFEAQIADTQDAREKGLMHRESLPKSQGMLFLFDAPQHIHMWMKDTSIALDMLFLNKNGTIFHIVENTLPYSTDVISTEKSGIAVFEVNAGIVKEHGISNGDTLIHSALGNNTQK